MGEFAEGEHDADYVCLQGVEGAEVPCAADEVLGEFYVEGADFQSDCGFEGTVVYWLMFCKSQSSRIDSEVPPSDHAPQSGHAHLQIPLRETEKYRNQEWWYWNEPHDALRNYHRCSDLERRGYRK